MKLNRQILRQHIKDEIFVKRIMNKAGTFRIETSAMGYDSRGHMVSINSFDSEEWIEKQTQLTKRDRTDRVSSSKLLLKMVQQIVQKGIQE